MQRHSLFMFSLVCADCQESVPSVIHSPIRHELEILSVNVFTLNIQAVLIHRYNKCTTNDDIFKIPIFLDNLKERLSNKDSGKDNQEMVKFIV